MRQVTQYLMENYFPSVSSAYNLRMPTPEEVDSMIYMFRNRIIIIEENEIKGVAIFLTLNNDTYNNLLDYNICDPEVLKSLSRQRGRNFHFVLLCAKGLKYIVHGINRAKGLNPRSISWYSQDMKTLHKFYQNGGKYASSSNDCGWCRGNRNVCL